MWVWDQGDTLSADVGLPPGAAREGRSPQSGGERPALGIGALEDVIIPCTVVVALGAMYVGDFFGFAYGCGAARSQLELHVADRRSQRAAGREGAGIVRAGLARHRQARRMRHKDTTRRRR